MNKIKHIYIRTTHYTLRTTHCRTTHYTLHTVEGFENNRNICEKLICVFKFRVIHHNTCRFWLKNKSKNVNVQKEINIFR